MKQQFEPISSLELTAYVIKQCQELNVELNITKTQKLLYICYGMALAAYNVQLVYESPLAWDYGPVFKNSLTSLQFFKIEGFASQPTPNADVLPEKIKSLIEHTVKHFGQFSPYQLTNWSKQKGSPWYKTTWGGMFLNRRIEDEAIRSYFLKCVME